MSAAEIPTEELLSELFARLGVREWLTTDELATELKVPADTVRDWRKHGTGPTGHRIGRHVRYHRTDIDTWTATRRDPN